MYPPIQSNQTAEILIVDDTLPNLHLLAGMLTNQGYRVSQATNGSEAIERIRESCPDLILMDVRMPGMDGYEVCRKLKAEEATKNIPVIFVSALDEQSDKIQGFAVGGIDYITKPYHIREVLARVDTHLTLRRLQRQLEEQNARLQQEIIERRRAEQALQATNDALEQRVAERTEELERSASELARMNASLNAELCERQKAEAEREALLVQVHKQADQVREIMNTIPEGLLLLEENGCVTLTNPAAQNYLKLLNRANQAGDLLERLGNYSLRELLNSPVHGLFHEVQVNSHVFEILSRPVADETTSRRWVMLIRDVSNERETQRQFHQQGRLAAVGQMAAGIAHDFNNILAVILLYSEMALNTPDIPPRLIERLRIIAQQSRRASELIEQILDFSRRSILERQPMDLLPFLKEQVKLLGRTLPENIYVDLTAEPGKYLVDADATRVQQMLLNLAVNARDAMPLGGKLSICMSARRTGQPIPCVACGEVTGGDWICLEVQDSGCGIDAKDLPYIFEPFYTTKGLGKGTGLGLSQVFGIVKSHEGHISVKSRLGTGTSISLYLPAEKQSLEDRSETDPSALVRGKGQTILLVEDEAATRQALAEGLMLINYRVVSVANGRDALEYLIQRPEHINLILSDVVMPQMGGVALLHTLREKHFTTPVIFMTGHPIPLDDEQDKELKGVVWLQKPLHLKQLSQIIDRALR